APTDADNLELNKGDNFIFAMDVSGSMATRDCPGGMSRMEYVKEKAIQFANEASKWDEDGIDVLTFGHQVEAFQGVTAEKAAEVIGGLKADEASTDTAAVVRKAWDLHKAGGYKQSVLMVVMDGNPADRNAVKQVIIDITNKVGDEREFNIAFLTV